MARTQTNHFWQDRQPGEQQEWDSLRDELEALLDQVNDRQRRTAGGTSGAQAPVLRPQRPTESRHQEALKSVQRAVQRFNEHEETQEMPAQSPERLQSAIEQIRASQSRSFQRSRTPVDTAGAANSNQFADLSRAIAEIGDRMGRFEGLIQDQGSSGRAIEEIAQQMEQLTGVVEMLATSVGEQGHIKRIEGQIARLAENVGQGGELDFQTVSERIDVLSNAFDRLSQLQAAQTHPEFPDYGDNFASLEGGMRHLDEQVRELNLGRIENGIGKVSDKLDDLDFNAIEACVRSVYDRIDALENNLAVPTPTIERLTRELAEFAELMRNNKGPVVSSTLVTRVDALNARLSEIEDAGPSVDALKFDMEELRNAVTSAMEPRFSAIETQIGTLADQFGAPSPLDASESITALETQIRRLADRLDETGRELTQLQSLYAENGPVSGQLDLSGLADLVAERTQAALASANAGGASQADSEALKSLESRLSAMFAEHQDSLPAPQDFSALEQSLSSVHNRLKGLEEQLARPSKVSGPVAPMAARSAEPTAPIADAEDEFGLEARRFQHPGLADEQDDLTEAAQPAAFVQSPPDNMPSAPTDEAPLNAPAYPEPEALPEPRKSFGKVPVPDSLMSEPGDYDVVRGVDDPADEFGLSEDGVADPVQVPRFGSDAVAPPPPPTSDFASGAGQSFANDTARDSALQDRMSGDEAAESENSGSRSTFIAAARRAAQQQSEDSGATSLFGRALSRFQKKREGQDNSPVEPALAAEEVRPHNEFEEPRRQRHSVLGATAEEDTAEDEEAGESFLTRYRRPLLLGAALLAVSLLTLNLVSQRLGGGESATPAGTNAAAPVESEPETPAPAAEQAPDRPINGAEQAQPENDFPVGSIDEQGMAPVPDVRVIDPTLYEDMPAPLELANFNPDQAIAVPEALSSLPQELGPQGLRDAALAGNAQAQFEIAAIYAEGRAVEQNLAAAALWYERSAAQGFAPAAYRLGNMYENGSGVEADLDDARFWYEKAASMGNRMSMHNLASILASGSVGEQDFGQAAVWFERAAGLGLTDSQFNLGMLYARGLGVPQDLADSYKWFSIAAEQGDEDAVRARDDIARSLDAETVALLQGDVSRWAPQALDISANFAPIGTWSDSFDPGPEIENRDIVQRVQAALNKLGFDAGTPDGLMGPKTHDAIRAFETATGMSESGEVNPRLLAVLGSQPV